MVYEKFLLPYNTLQQLPDLIWSIVEDSFQNKFATVKLIKLPSTLLYKTFFC